MRFFLGLLIGLLAAVGIAAAALHFAVGDVASFVGGRGKDGTRDRAGDRTVTFDYRDFDRIDAAGVFDLDVAVGGDYSITLSGPSEEIDRVRIEVVDGKLVLDRREGSDGRRIIRTRHGVDARVTLPALVGFDASGVVDADIEGVSAEAFRVAISGVGDVDISGECGSLDASVSGVGDLEAEDLRCRTVKVDVSGIGSASVYASEAVVARISGMGNIDVSGAPKSVEKDSGMFSKVNVR